MAKKQRIGILGGSFDPVHRGHIAAALGILNADYVDRLLVIPSGRPGYKSCFASAEDRWKMLVAACSCDKRLVPSAWSWIAMGLPMPLIRFWLSGKSIPMRNCSILLVRILS